MSISQPTLEDVWQLFRETDRKFQETDRKFQETTLQIQEMSKKIAEVGQKTKELENLFTTQWGRLMESLVEGALVRIFNNWGLPVTRTATRVKGDYHGQAYEFDILVHNGDAIIIVEVKTKLRPKDVQRFISKLNNVKIWLNEYVNNQIYGAMAFLQADAGAELMVINNKLFAIHATGDSAHIINPKEFMPRVW